MERNKILIRCGTYSIKKLIWENQHLSWIMCTWAALKDNAKLAKILWTITEPCSNREFPRVEQRNYHSLKIFVFHLGLMTWLVMQRNAWSDIVSWQTRRLNNSTKHLLHASMTTTSKKKKRNLLENCQSMLSNCSEMLFLGTNWTTRYSMVSEQTCKIHQKMDQSLWQTPESLDFIHS